MNYFSHDSNARHDEKIIKMRMKLNWESYGLYWALIEKLRDASEYMLEYDLDLLAYDLRVDNYLLEQIIKGFDLFEFTDDNTFFYSESLLNRMLMKEEKSKKLSEAGHRGNEIKRRRALNDNQVITLPESHPKEHAIPEFAPPVTPPEREATATITQVSKESKEVNKGSKGKKKEQPDGLQFPTCSPEFMENWTKLVAMPKWKKKMPLSLQMSLDKLAKYEDAFAVDLIKRAIEGDYQGVVFPDTDESYQKWLKAGRKPYQHPSTNHRQNQEDDGRL